jgi:hypothetical protein
LEAIPKFIANYNNNQTKVNETNPKLKSVKNVLLVLALGIYIFQALEFFSRTFLYHFIPNIKRMARTTRPTTPNTQLKLSFRITRNTTANKMIVAPSFQIRMNLEV